MIMVWLSHSTTTKKATNDCGMALSRVEDPNEAHPTHHPTFIPSANRKICMKHGSYQIWTNTPPLAISQEYKFSEPSSSSPHIFLRAIIPPIGTLEKSNYTSLHECRTTISTSHLG